MLALVAASVSMAVGAIIPIEAICDAAGLGRLAWQAAMARDLPLLLNLTMLIAVATTTAMAISESMTRRPAESVA
jgi:ABC-type dipeptide/oligopeptide/nickel transport system permease component